MLVSHKHKIVNVSVPKTGSTSIHHGLMSHLKIDFKLKNDSAQLYHLSAEDILRIMGPLKFKSYFSFGIVRNPYDRMVSLYHDFYDQRGIIKESSFEDFILNNFEANWKNNIHFLPQKFFLCSDGQVIVNSVFKFEQGMEAIIADIGKQLNFSFKKIGHARKSERGIWRDYYNNPRVIEIINQIYAEDFDIFGYDQLLINPKTA